MKNVAGITYRWLIIFFILTSCHKASLSSEYYRYFQVNLPKEAKILKIQKPKFFSLDNYIIYEFELPLESLKTFKNDVDKKYSGWDSSFETYVAGNFYTSYQMKNAIMVDRIDMGRYWAIIIDYENNKIISIYWNT
jgi:hypothetical protein